MIHQMTGQMNFSREFNTLYMASSPRAKFRTLSQLLWLFSMYQSSFLCEYISSNVNIYFMLSNQQTGSTDQLEDLESCSASKARDSSLVYNSRLSFVLSYQPIRSNIIHSQDNFYLTCSRNLVAFVIYMDLSLGFVCT